MTTTPSSTTCSRGDVVFVGVRFTDGSGVKQRPAVVVSVEGVHVSRADALIVPLTTRLATQRYGDRLLRDWAEAGLPRASMAKGVIETVDRSRFGRTLGRVNDRDLQQVESSLRMVLGL